MTEIYLHIVARMADYMDTHPYSAICAFVTLVHCCRLARGGNDDPTGPLLAPEDEPGAMNGGKVAPAEIVRDAVHRAVLLMVSRPVLLRSVCI